MNELRPFSEGITTGGEVDVAKNNNLDIMTESKRVLYNTVAEQNPLNQFAEITNQEYVKWANKVAKNLNTTLDRIAHLIDKEANHNQDPLEGIEKKISDESEFSMSDLDKTYKVPGKLPPWWQHMKKLPKYAIKAKKAVERHGCSVDEFIQAQAKAGNPAGISGLTDREKKILDIVERIPDEGPGGRHAI